MFCFVCGLLGHSERDCAVVYANPNKVIEKAYGTWLRASMKNVKNQNIGVRWLKNGMDGEQFWAAKHGTTSFPGDDYGGKEVTARFMEVDGQISEITGDKAVIRFVSQDLRSNPSGVDSINTEELVQGGK